MRSLLSPWLAALALLATTASVAVAAPLTFSHQGRLFDSAGAPLAGSHAIAFALHDAPAGGSVLWSEPHTVQVDNGYYAVVLGSSAPLNPDDSASDEVYLSIAVDGTPELSRTQLHSVPWALRADTATNVDGGLVNASEIRVNGRTVIDSDGTASVDWSDLNNVPSEFADGSDDGWAPPSCSAQQILVYNGLIWICEAKNLHEHSASDLTSGTVDMNRLPVGTSVDTVARGAHSHDATDITGRIAETQLSATMADLSRRWVAEGGLASLSVGGHPVIDGNGTWVGSPTGLVGPTGATGPQGPVGAALLGIRAFTATGTWTKPLGVTRVEVIVTGGGGGGGSHNSDDAQGGGGSGGTAIRLIDVSTVSSVAVTIGVGGTGSCGNTSNGGTKGGTTSFGTYLSATGGSPPTTWAIGGVAGIGVGGDLNLYGNDGETGNIDGQGNEESGGTGGSSYWGGGGSGGSIWGARRDGVQGSGGGGTHVGTHDCGGNGGTGMVVVREYGA